MTSPKADPAALEPTGGPLPFTGYHASPGGHPPQTALATDRAMLTQAYAVVPRGSVRDIVASYLPFWEATRFWVLARPLSGFAETFSQYVVEVAPGGGSDAPESDPGAEAVLFVVEGRGRLTVDDDEHLLEAGAYVYLPPGQRWTLRADAAEEGPLRLHWIRKAYEVVDGLDAPEAFVSSDRSAVPVPMPDTDERWLTTRFVDPADVRHDMMVNIVTLEAGASIPFTEMHVMEHGLYVLEGKAVYRLNTDWVEVEAGDFMWLRAFCPQACYAGGPGRFRYLLYKDVNRHARLPRRFL